MATRRLFGTDGIRGRANVEPLTGATVLRLGRALAARCGQSSASGRPQVVIGRDTRLSGPMLEHALAAGLCAGGADAVLAGELPTPAIAFLTRTLAAAAGVVISASHNPFADNGIKLFAPTGFKLPDAVEAEIEAQLVDAGPASPPLTGTAIGRVTTLSDAAARYVAFVSAAGPRAVRLERLKVVVDCAHGAAYRVAPAVLRELGADVEAIGVSPDGENINRDCGAVHPALLQRTVVARQAHFGIALDGDGDRLILVDAHGDSVDGDAILAILAADLRRRGALRHAAVVGTVMSNMGLEWALLRQGITLVRTAVGDRYVVEAMQQHGYVLGGEPSGHIIILDHSTTGDGLLAAVYVARLLVDSGKSLRELAATMTRFPQVILNVRVAHRVDPESVLPIREAIRQVEAALHGRGRVVVRASGTEPVIRVMVEGEDVEAVRVHAEAIAAVIGTHANA